MNQEKVPAKLKNAYEKILDFFFPQNLSCIFCGRDVLNAAEKPFCDECESSAPFNVGRRCKLCDEPLGAEGEVCDNCKAHHKCFDKAISPLLYVGSARGVVLKLKNDNARYLAPHMAKMMHQRLQSENFDFDIIVPVPLSAKSKERRKFNQSLLLAKELGKLCGMQADEESLVKVKETKHQKELGFLDRQRNLKDAFKIENKTKILNKRVLLIDDVLTTGATTNECARTLKKYADRVFVLTFARNPLKNEQKRK